VGALRGGYRAYTATARRWQDVFHAQTEDSSSSTILSSLKATPRVAQTLTEKIVQRYSLGLGKDKFVKSGGMSDPFPKIVAAIEQIRIYSTDTDL
jgi:homoaconitate hydratase